MFFDDDGIPFNPFMIGSPENSQRFQYKQPAYVSYPNPVLKDEKNSTFSIQSKPSKLGEVEPINEEAKHLTTENSSRMFAGRAADAKSELSMGSTRSATVKTIMSVKSKRSVSPVSKEPSQLNMAKSLNAAEDVEKLTSKMSIRTKLHKPTASTETLTEKTVENRDLDKDSKRSSTSVELKKSNISKLSVPVDHLETKSNISVKSKGSNMVSISSKSKLSTVDNKSSDTPQNLRKEITESIQQELAQSMETSKILAKKTAELSERLRAGNEFNHNRYPEYTRSEPLRRCREDRMALWCKDALLS